MNLIDVMELFDINLIEPKVGDRIAYAQTNDCGQLHLCVGTVTKVSKNKLTVKCELDGNSLYSHYDCKLFKYVENDNPSAEMKFDRYDTLTKVRHCKFIIL